VRSRINVISEIPEAWGQAVAQWKKHNEKYKQSVKDIGLVPEPNEEYLIYQTLIGFWPLGSKTVSDETLDRLKAYLSKSMKEAKAHTSWAQQNKPYEDALLQFAEKIVKDSEFVKQFLQFAERIFTLGKLNSLAQTVVKLISPGVPDIYQGQELWDFSLVDPDNRRPVDYAIRKTLLAQVKAAAGADLASFVRTAVKDEDNSGLIKLFVTERLLNLRNNHIELFLNGDYSALAVTGGKGNHVVAFKRSLAKEDVIAITARFFASHAEVGSQYWQDQTIQLSRKYRDAFTGAVYEAGSVQLKELFQHLPFSVLEGI